jgi:hypothetical protein
MPNNLRSVERGQRPRQKVTAAVPISLYRRYAGLRPAMLPDYNRLFGLLGYDSGLPVRQRHRIYLPISSLSTSGGRSIKDHMDKPGPLVQEFIQDFDVHGLRLMTGEIDVYMPLNNRLLSGLGIRNRFVQLGRLISALIARLTKLRALEIPGRPDWPVDRLKAVYNEFITDGRRTAGRLKDGYVVISRHPYDIVGMSFDRGWTSCMNAATGGYNQTLLEDIRHGTIVCYHLKAAPTGPIPDPITRPVARALIKPVRLVRTLDGQSGPEVGKPIAFISERTYGADSRPFRQAVNRIVEVLNEEKQAGVYKLSESLYNDGTNRDTIVIGIKDRQTFRQLVQTVPDYKEATINPLPLDLFTQLLTDVLEPIDPLFDSTTNRFLDSEYQSDKKRYPKSVIETLRQLTVICTTGLKTSIMDVDPILRRLVDRALEILVQFRADPTVGSAFDRLVRSALPSDQWLNRFLAEDLYPIIVKRMPDLVVRQRIEQIFEQNPERMLQIASKSEHPVIDNWIGQNAIRLKDLFNDFGFFHSKSSKMSDETLIKCLLMPPPISITIDPPDRVDSIVNEVINHPSFITYQRMIDLVQKGLENGTSAEVSTAIRWYEDSNAAVSRLGTTAPYQILQHFPFNRSHLNLMTLMTDQQLQDIVRLQLRLLTEFKPLHDKGVRFVGVNEYKPDKPLASFLNIYDSWTYAVRLLIVQTLLKLGYDVMEGGRSAGPVAQSLYNFLNPIDSGSLRRLPLEFLTHPLARIRVDTPASILYTFRNRRDRELLVKLLPKEPKLLETIDPRSLHELLVAATADTRSPDLQEARQTVTEALKSRFIRNRPPYPDDFAAPYLKLHGKYLRRLNQLTDQTVESTVSELQAAYKPLLINWALETLDQLPSEYSHSHRHPFNAIAEEIDYPMRHPHSLPRLIRALVRVDPRRHLTLNPIVAEALGPVVKEYGPQLWVDLKNPGPYEPLHEAYMAWQCLGSPLNEAAALTLFRLHVLTRETELSRALLEVPMVENSKFIEAEALVSQSYSPGPKYWIGILGTLLLKLQNKLPFPAPKAYLPVIILRLTERLDRLGLHLLEGGGAAVGTAETAFRLCDRIFKLPLVEQYKNPMTPSWRVSPTHLQQLLLDEQDNAQ